MLKSMTTLLTILIAATTFAAEAPKNEEQKTLYDMGLYVSSTLNVFNLTSAELEIVVQGLRDGQSGKKLDMDIPSYALKVKEFTKVRRKAQGDKLAPLNKVFLEKAAQEKGAVKTNSGLVYIPLREGTGASPATTDSVSVNYRGTLADGKEFDSSYKRNKPFEFKLNGVIPCWSEGLQKMKTGGKARLVCPSSIAYGDNGAGEIILPGATLDFEVELLEVKPSAPAVKPAEPAKK
jgi:FKBP-type peptidyl-prolyl cis-trans isomerase FkpA